MFTNIDKKEKTVHFKINKKVFHLDDADLSHEWLVGQKLEKVSTQVLKQFLENSFKKVLINIQDLN